MRSQVPRELKFVNTKSIDDSQYQTRLNIDDVAFTELIESIRRDGVLVPLLLSCVDDSYTVIAGHRRFKAIIEIGLEDVPAYVIEGEDNKAWNGAFAENMFRQDLTAIEESAAVVDCLEFGRYDVDQLARALGKTRQWIEDRVIIASWPEDIQIAVHAAKISTAAARNIAKIEDVVHRQMLLEFAHENGATARVTAAWLQAWQAGQVHLTPDQIEPAGGGSALPPIEPYSPCVICARKLKMIELHFTPVCDDCSHILLDLARELAGRTDGGP